MRKTSLRQQNPQAVVFKFLSLFQVDSETGCWIWCGPRVHKKGVDQSKWYGRFHFQSLHPMAHRWSYEHFVGPIPNGMSLDHKCRNPPCVNWEHLEPMPLRDNILQPGTLAARRKAMTHCKLGHEFTPENTRLNSSGCRICVTCKNARERVYWSKLHPKRAPKTHCLHGHEFTEANTWSRKPGQRSCRACNVIRQQATQARKRLNSIPLTDSGIT